MVLRRLLLFDVDGTLIETRGAGRSALRAAMLEVFGEAGTIDGHDFRGKTDPAIVQCTKDILNAVWAKWRRFPATVDACLMTVMVQAHHLECEFYDEHYKDGAYTDRHRRHLEQWHGKKKRLRAA